MDTEDNDVEVFERIPWEALEKPQDRRWALYLGAAALVMGAVGVTVGRGMATPTPVPVTEAPETTLAVATTIPTTVPAVALPDTTWSEADLMAVPAETLEDSAAALAEWYVVDYFTRSGADGQGRSFVEWSAVVAREWLAASTLELTVVLRRLAAEGDESYIRVPTEGWLVTTELGDQGWVVVGGPMPVAPPEPVVEMPPLEVQWADAAGLEWLIQGQVESERAVPPPTDPGQG